MAPADTSLPKPRSTIREVASAAGVSIATVSRVLNGRPDVAPQTRETVLRIVGAQGFAAGRGAGGPPGGVRGEPERTGALGRSHGARRRDAPDRARGVLLPHPLRCCRGALRAGHAD